MEALFIKCKEDGQISPGEFEHFQKLLKENESGMINTKSEIKSKDVKKVENMAKKGIASAVFESTLRKDGSRAPTLNIFCCPVIVSLNREPEQDRLTPTAFPPCEL